MNEARLLLGTAQLCNQWNIHRVKQRAEVIVLLVGIFLQHGESPSRSGCQSSSASTRLQTGIRLVQVNRISTMTQALPIQFPIVPCALPAIGSPSKCIITC